MRWKCFVIIKIFLWSERQSCKRLATERVSQTNASNHTQKSVSWIPWYFRSCATYFIMLGRPSPPQSLGSSNVHLGRGSFPFSQI